MDSLLKIPLPQLHTHGMYGKKAIQEIQLLSGYKGWNKMKYIVKEVLMKEVEAEDKETVEKAYENSEIVLTADDFHSVEIYPKGREERILDITTTFCEKECGYKDTCDDDCVLRKIERVLDSSDVA